MADDERRGRLGASAPTMSMLFSVRSGPEEGASHLYGPGGGVAADTNWIDDDFDD